MNIKEFAKTAGVSPYTLRYYEKIGLLKNVVRNASGHRAYCQKDLDWVGFIVRLKETGMPLAKIREYAQLREQGSSTLAKRQQLLEAHRLTLKQHIESQLNHLSALEAKISLYKANKVA